MQSHTPSFWHLTPSLVCTSHHGQTDLNEILEISLTGFELPHSSYDGKLKNIFSTVIKSHSFNDRDYPYRLMPFVTGKAGTYTNVPVYAFNPLNLHPCCYGGNDCTVSGLSSQAIDCNRRAGRNARVDITITEAPCTVGDVSNTFSAPEQRYIWNHPNNVATNPDANKCGYVSNVVVREKGSGYMEGDILYIPGGISESDVGGQWIEQVLPDYNFNIYFQLTKNNIEVLTKNETTDMNCIGYTWRGSSATYPQSKCILWSKTPDLGKFEEETPENEFEKADLVNGAYVYRGYAAPPETTSDVNFDRNNPSSRFCSLDNNQCDYNTGTNTCINIDWPTSAQCNAFDWNSTVHYAGPGYVPIQIEQMNANVDSWREYDFGYTEGQRTRTYLKIQPRGDWVTRRCGYADEDDTPTTSYNLVSIPTSDTSVYHETVFPDGISQSNVYKIVIPYKTEDENGENKIDTDRFHTTEINFFAD